MNLQYTVTHRSSTLCAICFPARTTMALFKCHPIGQIRTGRLMFQAQKKVIKQSLGQWIASNWEAHTWQQGSSFNRQHRRKPPEWKSFGRPARCIEPGLTSAVVSGSWDCRSGVEMVSESRPDHHRETKGQQNDRINVKWSILWAVDWSQQNEFMKLCSWKAEINN